MSFHQSDLLPIEIRHPGRPEPQTFAFKALADWRDLSMCRTQEDRELLFKDMKRRASHALAEHIAAHCKWMELPYPFDGNLGLRIELTIHDRGAYENWIPRARQEARQEGWKEAMDCATRSLPYGLADAAQEFYG